MPIQCPSLTSDLIGQKLSARDVVAKDADKSPMQIQQFIRLIELNQKSPEKVDTRRVAFIPAVGLSYLKPEDQKQLLDAMESEQATPSLSQAQRLRR